VNLYSQDQARFGMMNHIGRYLTASGVKPIVSYQHIFKTTYLYGSYSPINGDSFVWEINGVDTAIFEAYLKGFSQYKPNQYKIVVIDNAGFHSTKNIEVPDNIYLLRIPPYNPELNPCEQIWQYIKNRFKNQRFETMQERREWLHNTVYQMQEQTIKSITGNHHYLNAFYAAFKI
jgi:transposase